MYVLGVDGDSASAHHLHDLYRRRKSEAGDGDGDGCAIGCWGQQGVAARRQRVWILVLGCLGHAPHPRCSVGGGGTDGVSGSRCRSCARLSQFPTCTLATVAQISPFSTVLHALSAWFPSRPIRRHPERGVVCVHTATPSCSAHRAFRVCRWCADPLPVAAVSCRAETTVWMGRKSARNGKGARFAVSTIHADDVAVPSDAPSCTHKRASWIANGYTVQCQSRVWH